MLSYPSIMKSLKTAPEKVYAYDKLDGSNMRAEWTPKSGFNKFGSRRRLINEDTPILGEAIPLFKEKYSTQLHELFLAQGWDKVTVFFEFYGDNSFAGLHEDEQHYVTLFDVNVSRKGFLTPEQFNELLQGVDTAKLLYVGEPTEEFTRSVQDGTLEGMTFEGVICKSGYSQKNRLISYKVKNQAWLDKLRSKCTTDEEYERLA